MQTKVKHEPINASDGVIDNSLLKVDLTKELGRGGFGIVYQAKYRGKDAAVKELLIKELSPSAEEEFKSEAKIMLQLHDPSIVHLYGVTQDKPHRMVLEFCSLGSLDRYLQKRKVDEVSWEVRFHLATGIASGLHYLHTYNPMIIHGDLKSLNVLLTGDSLKPDVKLADFGLSKLKTETQSKTKTSRGDKGWSIQWMAPELFSLKGKKTPASDMYAFGITLWEIASHEYPYSNCSLEIIRIAVEKGERTDVPVNTPPLFAKVMTDCWLQNPMDRPTARVALEQLQTYDSAVERTKTAKNAVLTASSMESVGFLKSSFQGSGTPHSPAISGFLNSAAKAGDQSKLSDIELLDDDLSKQNSDISTVSKRLTKQFVDTITTTTTATTTTTTITPTILTTTSTVSEKTLKKEDEAPSPVPTSILKDFNVPLSREEAKRLTHNWLWSLEDKLHDWLWSFVEQSKVDEKASENAALAITTLNALGVAFIGKYGDLSGAKIPGANLDNAFFSHTRLNQADLRNVSLVGAYLGNADFTGANLEGVKFEEFPSLLWDKKIDAIGYSPDGQIIFAKHYSNGDYTIALFKKTTSGIGDIVYIKEELLLSRNVMFSPDGSLLTSVTHTEDWKTLLLDTKTLKVRGSIQGESKGFSPDGAFLFCNHKWWNTGDLTESSLSFAPPLPKHASGFSITFSPDGSQLAYWHISCEIIEIWDLRKRTVNKLEGCIHVSQVKFSPDSSLMSVTQMNLSTVRLWDTKTCTERNLLVNTYCILFSPNETQLALVKAIPIPNEIKRGDEITIYYTNKYQVELWDAKMLSMQKVLKENLDSYDANMIFSPDGLLLVFQTQTSVTDRERHKETWLCETKSFRIRKIGHSYDNSFSFNSITFSPDGLQLALTDNNKIHIYNTNNLIDRNLLERQTYTVLTMGFSQDKSLFIMGSHDKTIQLWDIKNQLSQQKVLEGHKESVTSLSSSKDGLLLASCSQDRVVRFWDIKNPSEQYALPQNVIPQDGTAEFIFSLSPDGLLLALLILTKYVPQKNQQANCKLILWDTKNQVVKDSQSDCWGNAMTFSNSGNFLAVVSVSHSYITLYDMKRWPKKKCILRDRTICGSDSNLAFSGNDVLLAFANMGDGHLVSVWNVNRESVIKKLQGHTDAVRSIAFSLDGSLIASGSQDHTVRLWDTKSYTPSGLLKKHESTVLSIIFNPNGWQLVTGSEDGVIFLWGKTSVGTSLSQEKWLPIYRVTQNTALLTAPGTFFKGAKISEANRELLKQRGANDNTVPDYENNPHLFWAKQQKSHLVSSIESSALTIPSTSEQKKPEQDGQCLSM